MPNIIVAVCVTVLIMYYLIFIYPEDYLWNSINSQSHKDAMPLRTDTTVEYYFDNAYLYYCKEHECLRVSNNHEDSVVLNNVSRKDIDTFISNYIDYVLEQPELKEAFKKAAKVKILKEATDDEGRPLWVKQDTFY